MTQNITSEFNVKSVELKDTNLIEASAGTGKTYSIAILVLRLILEKNLPLKEILMVTFTKAAVAELQGRIRKFIRMAFYYANGESINDSLIMDLVDLAINNKGKDNVLLALKQARMQLDETSIFTIHSFCQKSLNEFAFETGQLFDAEVIQEQGSLIEKAVNEFWRTKVTTLSTDILELLWESKLSRHEMMVTVRNVISGTLFDYDKSLDVEEIYQKWLELPARIEGAAQEFEELYNNTNEKNNRNQIKIIFNKRIDTVEKFRDKLIAKESDERIVDLFPTLLEKALEYKQVLEQQRQLPLQMKYFLYGMAADNTKEYVVRLKNDLSVFSFDDLINKMHEALCGPYKEQLVRVLQRKYKAAFIDEFQDTDEQQYDIFHTLFGSNAIVFYIGDPKQSIYGFRGADIDTYKKAATRVAHRYTMRQNFRSTPQLINAYNDLFLPVSNAFLDKEIKYEEVFSKNDFENIKKDGEDQKPVTLVSCDGAGDIPEQVAFNVLELLAGGYTIDGRKVKPSDIGILVRGKDKGMEIKRQLVKLNIPAITIDETLVLETLEAEILIYVLQAMLNANKANVNRALYNFLTNKTKEDLLNQMNDTDLNKFIELKQVWNNIGIYGALQNFLKHYNVYDHLFSTNKQSAERSISNILQIMELLHKQEVQAQPSQEELISWLINGNKQNVQNSEDYTQRLESDEDAVQIVTIHKSKGLAYNIVFAPTLELTTTCYFDTYQYKKPNESNYYFAFTQKRKGNQYYEEQTRKENVRLLYVALTRAVFKCFIYESGKSKSTLAPFLVNINSQSGVEQTTKQSKPGLIYKRTSSEINGSVREFSNSIKNNWQYTSFSGLNNLHSYSEYKKYNGADDYDQFVFEQMPKGAIAGDFLHELFENTDFTQSNFNSEITHVGRKYPAIFKLEHQILYHELLEHTLHANLPIDDFSLSSLSAKDKLVEMEFYFDLQKLQTSDLNKLLKNNGVHYFGPVDGLMHGFIDLVFRHNGKYYILDWKSNYLGSSLSDYSSDKLDQAIRANNYHLQYLIYTVALKRYLEQQISDFNYDEHFGGVIYMFLRGCRAEQDTGVFYDKPEHELIEKMDSVFGKLPVRHDLA